MCIKTNKCNLYKFLSILTKLFQIFNNLLKYSMFIKLKELGFDPQII